MRHLITFFIFLFSVVNVTLAQDRPVLYVHGHGAGAGTWDILEGQLEGARRMNGSSPGFNSDNGIGVFANGINTALRGEQETRGQNTTMIIAHSNGGIATREFDRRGLNTGAETVDCIVTVGSPHDGAAIVNSINTGLLASALNRGRRDLLAGPNTYLRLNGRLPILRGITGVILTDLLDEITTGALFNFAAPLSAQNVAVGTPFMNTLNGAAPSVPLVSVHGNENSPVHWRLLRSIVSDNTDDEEYAEIAQHLQNVYLGISLGHFALGAAQVGFGWWNPAAVARGAMNLIRGVQFLRGHNWLKRSEEYWLQIIQCEASFEFQDVSVIVPFTGCNEFQTGGDAWLQCLRENCDPELSTGGSGGCFRRETYSQRITTNTSSDGFFCMGTQIYDDFSLTNNYEARGVNHHQETNTTSLDTDRRNDEMVRVFDAVFDRDDVFEIFPR